VRRVQHYSLATVGPVGSAGAQFALSLVLLRRLDPEAFGGFSFLLRAAQRRAACGIDCSRHDLTQGQHDAS
jgi:hypothetical protein